MNRNELVWGLMLIGIGLIFLASNLGTLPELDFRRMWPLILLVIGVCQLFSREQDAWVGGLSLILTGAVFLAHNYRIVRLHDSWPLFIVIAGLSVMFGARRRNAEGKKS